MGDRGAVTLIGGTGFVGRALATRLVAGGLAVRVVARHAHAAANLPEDCRLWAADVSDTEALRSALTGADAAVYLPGRVQGRRREQFTELHVRGADSCAACRSCP